MTELASKCDLCQRKRTVADPSHPMDAYDYTPMQAMTGQPFGWFQSTDESLCPECMEKMMRP